MRNKIVLATVLSLALLCLGILFTGCDASYNLSTAPPIAAQTPAATDFGRMLAMVPSSFLQEHDIWYGNPGQAWELLGIETRSLDSIRGLSPEKINEVASALVGIKMKMRFSAAPNMAALTGFDHVMVDRSIFSEVPSPWSFSINEGDFDDELIKSKLVEQGYTRMEYGPNSYYSLRGDNQMDLRSDLGRLVLTELNRVAVMEDTVVTASTTGAINGVLDVMSGKEPSIMDGSVGRALTDSLGEVLSGVIMDSAKVLNPDPSQKVNPFYFNVPANWGLLHPYDLVGMGYKNDGRGSAWIFSLFYRDASAASADADTLVNRMQSYTFLTQNPDFQRVPEKRNFAFYGFSIGKPVVKEYPEGATLTVECRGNPWLLSQIEMRDLLFLAPDPAPYVATAPPSTGPMVPKQPPFNPEPGVFSNNMTIAVGAQDGYDDAAHQRVEVHLSIRNISPDILKNVRVIVSSMLVNSEPKPAVMEAEPETPGRLDFSPGESETYNITWNFDGSRQTKEEIAALADQTKLVIKFTAPDGRELTQELN